MGEARWLPLFVTADVSADVSPNSQYLIMPTENVFKIVNSVLKSAVKETQEDEDFENRWSLISHPSQLTVTKPSVSPVEEHIQTGLFDASVETLQDFVTTRCGENGLGHDSKIYMNWLANDAFGVIDAKTAEDETILFCVRELVDAIQEAEVRLAWNKGVRVSKS
jgi:hypothetical protein